MTGRNRIYLLAFDHRGSFQKKLLGIAGEPTAEESSAHIRGQGRHLRRLPEGARRRAAARRRGDPRRRAVRGGHRAGPRALSAPAGDARREERPGRVRLRVRGRLRRAHRRLRPDVREGARPLQPGRRLRGEPATGRAVGAARRLAPRKRLPLPLRAPRPAGAEPARDASAATPTATTASCGPASWSTRSAKCQEAGVEPDIWKIEGLDERDDCVRVAEAARAGGRDQVDCVVLGRGGDEEKVVHWLRTGADVPGFVGFAVGRTIWWNPLEQWLAGASADEAAATIAHNYRGLVDAYASAAGDK